MKRLIDHYKDDIETGSSAEKPSKKTYWTRLVAEELRDRGEVTDPPVKARKKDYVTRWQPYWSSVPLDELVELSVHLKRYAVRKKSGDDADELEDGTDDAGDDGADDGQ